MCLHRRSFHSLSSVEYMVPECYTAVNIGAQWFLTILHCVVVHNNNTDVQWEQ